MNEENPQMTQITQMLKEGAAYTDAGSPAALSAARASLPESAKSLKSADWSSWLRSLLSEPDGAGSFARLASLVMLLLQVAAYIRTGQMPDWQTLAACGAPYAVNKALTQISGVVKR